MNEIASNSEEIIKPNRSLREIVDQVIVEKKQSPVFILEDETIVRIPSSDYSAKQEKHYEGMLNDWLANPNSNQVGILGYAYEIFLAELLRFVFPSYRVIHTPGELDFIPRALFKTYGPSADLIVGERLPHGIKPHILVGAGLKSKSGGAYNHFLRTDVFYVLGERYFPDLLELLPKFGLSQEPVEFASRYAPKIKETFVPELERLGYLYLLD